MAMKIDELNSPKEFDVESFIEKYFEPMQITENQKEERKKASRDFLNYLLFVFALLMAQQEYNAVDWAYFEETFATELRNNALKYARNTRLLEMYIYQKAEEFTRITREHIGEDDYWTSEERAAYEAVNEANSVLGYEEMEKAKDAGYLYKTWRTEKDLRVRKDHVAAEGKKKKIDDYFVFPDCIMLMPHDDVHGTERQTINCRCSLKYTKD